MTTLHTTGLQLARAILRVLFAASLVALLAATMTGGVQRADSAGGVALASSSAPFAASSPATTLPPAATTTIAAPPTSEPTAVRTGEAWGSRWFLRLLALSILLGVLTAWPGIGRRRAPETDSTAVAL